MTAIFDTMNPRHYHILNGDALREQFPSALSGDIIVARECLVDGPTQGATLEELYMTRAEFIAEEYTGYSVEDYGTNAAQEFLKIQSIPVGSSVHLWFEDDLFCQVNFWFVMHLLVHYSEVQDIYLVRPTEHNQYGFGTYTQLELEGLWRQRQLISDPQEVAKLWDHYQSADLVALDESARKLQTQLPFIRAAVAAHVARLPSDDYEGRPREALRELIEEYGEEDFGVVFREFCKRESIYGYGDVQVRRLFDQLLGEKK